jgi:hypothetical protein
MVTDARRSQDDCEPGVFATAGFSPPVRFALTTPPRHFPMPRYANFRYGIRWTPDGQSITYRDWVEGL